MSDRLGDLTARIETLEAELGQLKSLVISTSVPGNAAPSPSVKEDAGTEPSASRRDMLRYGAVALGAAAAAGMAASPAEAQGTPLLMGTNNFATINTYLNVTTGNSAFIASSVSSNGLVGYSETGIGVNGATSNGSGGPYAAGVMAFAYGITGTAPAVWASASSPAAPAVLGQNASGGNAVRAEVPAGSSSSAIALYALNYSTYTGGAPGAGGFAIYGLCANGHGLVGATAAAGAAAVVGASNGVAGAYAAAFYGPVVVGGNLTVFGAKSAAVPHPDGSHRRLYCVESPESWFEDFGRGTLRCGEAAVALDPDFAAVVDASDYHVFLTGDDGIFDLCVSSRASQGFRVKAQSADAAGEFSWRVVAKRKDIAGPRLERVEVPKEPTLPEVPASVHEPMPSPPDIPRRRTSPRRSNGKP